MGFPCSSVGKEFACRAGDLGSIPGLGRSPGEGNGNPTPVSLPGKSHGQRNLVDCSPWGRKESGTTERLTHTCAETERLGCESERLRTIDAFLTFAFWILVHVNYFAFCLLS